MQDKYVIIVFGIMTAIIGMILFYKREEPILSQQPIYQSTPTTYNMTGEEKYASQNVTKTEEVRPTKPHIINHILTNADVWYEIRLPEDVVTWQLRARGDYDLEYSFEPSQTTTMILPSGAVLNENTAPNMSIRAIYVMSGTAGSQVDIEMWRNLG